LELRVQLKVKTINIALETLGGNIFGTKFCCKYDNYYEANGTDILLINYLFVKD
jgi:hypothetical protein